MVIGLGVYQGLEFMLERGAVELLGRAVHKAVAGLLLP
jgi:hypothetical protein